MPVWVFELVGPNWSQRKKEMLINELGQDRLPRLSIVVRMLTSGKNIQGNVIPVDVPGSLQLLYENVLECYGRHRDSSQEATVIV